jgi:TctA family transporter
LKGANDLANILTLVLSFIIASIIFNYLSKYLISSGKIPFKAAKTTKGKIIWTIICCAIYIVGYVLIDFLTLGVIGFNIARGVLLAIFVTMLLFDSNKK